MSIQIQNLSRDYRGKAALCEINTTINDGEITSVLGANGAGKSTLLRLISGWLPPTKGRVQIDGYTMRMGSRSVRRRVMLLDEPSKGEKAMVAMIGQAVSDYNADRDGIEAEVADWFERLDLVGTYGQSANAMSKGQRYKVAMVCLFLVRPRVWLLDEPFSAGLDARGLDVLETEMKSHANSGGIVVFSSQWPEHANRLAQRSLVLHEGSLMLNQSIDTAVPDELISDAGPALAAVLSGLGGSHD